jgi:hypothetical protein
MCTAAATQAAQYSVTPATLLMAFELGQKTWKLGPQASRRSPVNTQTFEDSFEQSRRIAAGDIKAEFRD